MVLTEHLFKNSNVFYFAEVLSVTNFLIIKEESDSSLQDKVLSHCKTSAY